MSELHLLAAQRLFFEFIANMRIKLNELKPIILSK